MKRILLVFPGQKGVRDVNLPLSILYVAKPLIDNGYEVQLLDCRIDDYREVDLNDILYVGISAMSGRQIHHGLEAAEHIRENDPTIPLIWGGPHPTIIPEQTIGSDLADIVVRGEGEETLLELTREIENEQSFESVRGLTYKSNGRIVSTPDRDPIDQNRIGDLPYHLLNMDAYPNIVDKFDYISSRGCPHRCTFCSDSANYKRKWRAKSPEVVIDELEYIVGRYRPRRITIQDANFFVDRKRVEEICLGILEKGWDINLYGFIRCDYVPRYEPSFVELLREAGFTELAFGAESGCDRILDFIRKDITRGQVIQTVEIFKRHGIKPVISLMMGLPTETDEELRRTLELYDEIMKIHPRAMVNGIFIFTPFPGAALTQLVEEEYGYNPPHLLEDWGVWRWSSKDNIPWVEKKSRGKYEAIYLIIRFFFVRKLLKSWSFQQKKVRCGSTLTTVAVIILNSLFCVPARLRWKYRFFKFPIEWKIWYAFYRRFKGVD